MNKFPNILVAFDLNKTLFFKSESPLPIRHHTKLSRYFFYVRPHIKELIEFLHQNQINYCFWSNMMLKNCLKYVEQLKSLGMNRHCGIFDQEFCDFSKIVVQKQTGEPGQKVKSVKNLNKLAALFNIDVDHCILVDDSKQKNVEGCHLIHIDSYLGQEDDKELLLVIKQLEEFRKPRINEADNLLPMLKFTEYKYQSYLDNIPLNPPKKVKYVQKPAQKEENPQQQKMIDKVEKVPTQKQLLIEKDPQLRMFKEDLVASKQQKKSIVKQIQEIEKAAVEMAEQVKRKSQGKKIQKGDDLLVQVLTFAKKKKVSEKRIAELKEAKKKTQDRIALLKKLMGAKIKQLCPNHEEDQTKDEKFEEGEQKEGKPKNKKKKSNKNKKQEKQEEKKDLHPNEPNKVESEKPQTQQKPQKQEK